MTDLFRKHCITPPDETQKTIFNMKEQFERVLEFMTPINNREMSLAKTALQEACMWATQGHILDAEKKIASTISV